LAAVETISATVCGDLLEKPTRLLFGGLEMISVKGGTFDCTHQITVPKDSECLFVIREAGGAVPLRYQKRRWNLVRFQSFRGFPRHKNGTTITT
jgi:hypothetical protein